MSDPENRLAANVAVILAAGVAVALNIVTLALLWAAITHLAAGSTAGLSENGTQLLTGWGGGMIGVLGSYIGFAYGKRKPEEPEPPEPTPAPPPKTDPYRPTGGQQ